MLFLWLKGASMTDFHDLQLKEQLLLQQKWEDDVDVDEGNVCDFCVRSVKPNKFFDETPVAAHRDEPGQHDDSSSAQVQQVKSVKPVKPVKPEPKNKARRTVKTVTVDDRVTKFGKYGLYNGLILQPCFCMKKKDSRCRSEPSDKKCKKLHLVRFEPMLVNL